MSRISIQAPLENQVIQRSGFSPFHAHHHNPGGPALGEADVCIQFTTDIRSANVAYLRVVDLGLQQQSQWTSAALNTLQVNEMKLRLPAGWYELTIRIDADQESYSATHRFGVGDVFQIFGQSYATNTAESLLQVQDPLGRGVAWNSHTGTWQRADDPQPDGRTKAEPLRGALRGSPWPCMLDHLLPLARVPIGLATVAAGGAASKTFMPGSEVFEQMVRSAQEVGRFLAVLWQQGESDVIEDTPPATYKQNIRTIQQEFCAQTGKHHPWVLALSTMHPTTYIKPKQEHAIRQALLELSNEPGFLLGPDTDILGGSHRAAGEDTGRHYSRTGQRLAGWLWATVLWSLFYTPILTRKD
jgi:hypothetical protein